MEVGAQLTGGAYSEYGFAAGAAIHGNFAAETENAAEFLDAMDIFTRLKDNFLEEHTLTAEELEKETDWREMSDSQWNKLMESIDKYIDAYKEELKNREELQKEAAVKGAAKAPADRKALAASRAALKAAANGIVSEVSDSDADALKKASWTYDLQTDNQDILAAAKLANETACAALTKAQELELTGATTEGVSETENVMEYAAFDKAAKTWKITAFTKEGIVCSECTDGVTKELWRIEYESPADYKRAWDFLEKTDEDADWEFAASRSFWEDFLAGKAEAGAAATNLAGILAFGVSI